MNNIKFSILVPAVPSRLSNRLTPLLEKLLLQCKDRSDVEILSFIDNKKRTIGEKRDALVQLSQGDYVAFVDDDDDIADDYVQKICDCIVNSDINPDVIVFNQIASINGNKFLVEFGLEYENEQAQQLKDGSYIDIHRKPFHVCAWKSSLAKGVRFPVNSWGEDWAWAEQLVEIAKTQERINSVLHYYIYSDQHSEAPDLSKKNEDTNLEGSVKEHLEDISNNNSNLEENKTLESEDKKEQK